MLARMTALLARVTDEVSLVGPGQKYSECGVYIVEDRWPGDGPLGGIITALQWTRRTPPSCEWNLILGCDMPFVTREWLNYLVERAMLSDAEVIAPRSTHGLEPLCACWRTAAQDTLQSAFGRGVRKVTEAMKLLRMEVLDEAHWKRFDSHGRLFCNMNTPQDYEEAARVWLAESQ